MATAAASLNTTIARKFLMGLTGLGLVGFAVSHLVANLALLVPDEGRSFNDYAAFLHSLGNALYALEAGLLACFLVHIVLAIRVTIENKAARPVKYAVVKDAGGPSQKTLASRSMIISGLVLLVFLVVHLITFKFGDWSKGEHGHSGLAALVVTKFKHPAYSGFYVVCMALLGTHLRHGFWSAFQSLGIRHPRVSPAIHSLGWVIAISVGLGFLFLPVWIFLDPLGMYTGLVRP